MVSSESQRSTRFSHKLLVGVKRMTKRGVLCEPAADGRCLVAGGIVKHEVDIDLDRRCGIDRLEELQELNRAMALVQRADHLARLDVRAA